MKIVPRLYERYKLWILSLLITLLFGVGYNYFIPKFKITPIKENYYQNGTSYYVDVDNDGYDDRIDYVGYKVNTSFHRLVIQLRDSVDNIKAIWNHNGEYIDDSRLIICDWNNDNNVDLFTISYLNNSIFLNYIDLENDGKFHFSEKLIDTTQILFEEPDLRTYYIGEQDANGDGYNEIYFTLNAGFSLQPRNIYYYDVKNDVFKKSCPSFAMFLFQLHFFIDINGDGLKEIIPSYTAADNTCDTTLPFNDKSVFTMAYDHNLELIFKPHEIKWPLSKMYNFPIKRNDSIYIFSYFHTVSPPRIDSVFMFNHDGKILKKREITKYGNNELVVRPENPKQYFSQPMIWYRDGRLLKLDFNLNVVEYKQQFDHDLHQIFFVNNSLFSPNINFILRNSNNLFITHDGLNNPVYYKLPVLSGLITSKDVLLPGHARHFINLGLSQGNLILDYNYNIWYTYQWIIFFLVFFLTALLLYIIQRINTLLKNKRLTSYLKQSEEKQKKLARELHDELGSKLTALKIKMHELNGHAEVKKLKELSDHVTSTHTEIRNIVHNLAPPQLKNVPFHEVLNELINEYKSNSNLKVNIEFLPDKSIVQHIKHNSKNEIYRIIQETLTNAIKHAEATEIIVQIVQHKKHLEVTIDDNGNGFDVEKTIKNSSGIGLDNLKSRVSLLGGHIEFISQPNIGTSVTIILPHKIYEKH
jgi:signal transduction histidine kinase